MIGSEKRRDKLRLPELTNEKPKQKHNKKQANEKAVAVCHDTNPFTIP
jgi:hypothetical protein